MDTWEVIKDFYESKFGIDGWLVEMYANLDILSLCISGASNPTISRFLEIPEDEILSVLRDTFAFDGWDTDLPINPILIYNSSKLSSEHFMDFSRTLREELTKTTVGLKLSVDTLFNMCKTFSEIEERIENEWV